MSRQGKTGSQCESVLANRALCLVDWRSLWRYKRDTKQHQQIKEALIHGFKLTHHSDRRH